MNNVEEKLVEIKSKFFENIFNQEFLSDSYEFLQSIDFFSQLKDNKFSIFKNTFLQFHNEIIFLHIKEIHESHQKKLTATQIKPRYTINKVKNLFVEKLKGLTSIEQTNEENENKYASLVEQLFKKREEDLKKENLLSEKCDKIIKLYEREQFIEFLSQINSDPIAKERIFKEKGLYFTNLVLFEESLLNFFLTEFTKKDNYNKIDNKNFDIRYKTEQSGITLMFEKDLEINILHFLSLLYECDFFPKWLPFNSESKCVFQPGKAKKLVYMLNDMVLMKREFLLYGFGVNKLKTDKIIYLLCQSVNDDNLVFKEHISKVSSSRVRGDIRIFGYEMKIIRKSKLRVKALINVNPKIGFMPQSWINSMSQKFATDLFAKLIEISKKFEGSEYQNKFPSKIDREFYSYIEEELANLDL